MEYSSENIKSVEQLDKYFLINWHITGWCNFHCPYCINREFATTYTSEENILKIADAINNFINSKLNGKRIQLRLIGGEPTYYNLSKILDRISRLDRITLVTNFSRANDFFKDLYLYCMNRKIKFFLICSYHKEHKNFIDKVAELTEWCRSTKEYRKSLLKPQVSLLADENFSQEVLDKYLNKGIDKIRISILRDDDQNHINLSKEQLKVIFDWTHKYDEKILENYANKNIKDRGFLITYTDNTTELCVNATHFTNKFKEGIDPTNFYCTSGLTNMVIFPDGNVIINKCDYWKDISWGNILNGDIVLPDKPLKCPIINSQHKTKCTLCSGVDLLRNIKDV